MNNDKKNKELTLADLQNVRGAALAQKKGGGERVEDCFSGKGRTASWEYAKAAAAAPAVDA